MPRILLCGFIGLALVVSAAAAVAQDTGATLAETGKSAPKAARGVETK
jgi:hypothetical protein